MLNLYLHQMRVKGNVLEHINTISLEDKITYILGREGCRTQYIEFPMISEEHAEITVVSQDQITLRALDSTNGTFTSGSCIEPYSERTLKVGRRFHLGVLEKGGLLFELSNSERRAPRNITEIQQAGQNTAVDVKNNKMENCVMVVAGGNIKLSSLPKLILEPSTSTKSEKSNFPYKLLYQIGSGGQSNHIGLYHHKNTQEIVCCKKYTQGIATSYIEQELTDCSDREQSILKNLNHPNIIKAYNFFIYEQKCDISDSLEKKKFFVMEYIVGDDLKKSIKSVEDATIFIIVKWMRDISDALCYLHKRSIFHRDVTPANIMLETTSNEAEKYRIAFAHKNGKKIQIKAGGLDHCRVVLIDFGLARGNNDERSMTNYYAGTEGFIPQERKDIVNDKYILEAKQNKDLDLVNQRKDRIYANHDSYGLGKTFEFLSKEKNLDPFLEQVRDEQCNEEEISRCTSVEIFKERLQLWLLLQDSDSWNDIAKDLAKRVLVDKSLSLALLETKEKHIISKKVEKKLPHFWQGEIINPLESQVLDTQTYKWPTASTPKNKGRIFQVLQKCIHWRGEFIQPGIVLVGDGGDLDSFDINALQTDWSYWECNANVIRKHYLSALAAEKNNDFDLAEEYYHKAIKLNEEDTSHEDISYLFKSLIRLDEKRKQAARFGHEVLDGIESEMKQILNDWPSDVIEIPQDE